MERHNTPTLETKRLVLRKFTGSDIGALFSICGDVEVNTYLPWYPLRSLQETAAYFKREYAAAYDRPEGYRYAVCLRADNRPIGYIHVSTEESHDLGYGLKKEFWGAGITAEAGRAVLAQVERDGFPYVTATHDVKNFRSGSVMKRIGMRYQYTYEEQWQPKDILVTFRMYQLNFGGRDCGVYRKYWDGSAVHFIEQI